LSKFYAFCTTHTAVSLASNKDFQREDIHTIFVVTSEKMKVILITTSVSFGDFFCRLSTPYNDIPAHATSEERKKEIKALMDDYRIYYV
jgi:hypothetical protein